MFRVELNHETDSIDIYDRSGVDGLVYSIPYDRLKTSAEILDWIIQLSKKTWVTPDHLATLIYKLDEYLRIQENFCSCGMEQGPVNVRDLFVREKV